MTRGPGDLDGADPLFLGVGEIGAALAERDWAATPLGPPGTWPAGLRGAVRMLLTSRFSMWMAWGPELTMFYNDSYRRDTLRTKHPWALGRPCREVWAEIWDDIGPRIESVLSTGEATWDSGLRLVLERGGYPEETYHTFSYSPLADESGRVAGMLCVVTEDTDRVIGDRRMTTLRELAATLADARSPDGVLAAARERLAADSTDLPVTLAYLFDPDPPDATVPATIAPVARLAFRTGPAAERAAAAPEVGQAGEDWPLAQLDAGRPALLDKLPAWFRELRVGRWDGVPTQAALVPLRTHGQGGSAGFLVIVLNPFRRYDERYQLFLELLAGQIASGLSNAAAYQAQRSRADELAELDRAKTAFFANVSHEFRTPLTLMLGPLADLRAHPVIAGDAGLAGDVDVVHRNGLRLGRMVNALLDFSRLQAGRARARFEPSPLAELTGQLAAMFRSAAQRAGLELRVHCPPLPDPVWVDRDMWEQVVLNLLSNAVKFTFDGSITVAVDRVDGPDGLGRARLRVTDTGIGVPEGELPRLFERFHQIAGARGRSGEGSGIGLALAMELVELHGGTVAAGPGQRRGTEFTVLLPFGPEHLPADQRVPPDQRVPTDATGTEAGRRPVEPSGTAEPLVTEVLRWLPGGDPPAPDVSAPGDPRAASGRVLVVDDDVDMREYLRLLLGRQYVVESYQDGVAALEAARADPPDLIVADVMMPGLDGLSLLAGLRGGPVTARVPVLLLSARAGQDAAVEGLTAGADDYLVKPFSSVELLARVAAHLRLGRDRREAELRFRALADATPALIWVDDQAGRRVFVNQAWTTFTGLPNPDTAPDVTWREHIHPDDRARYQAARADATGSVFELEYRLRTGAGRYRWVLDRGAPLGSAERPGGHVGGCLDIDDRHREQDRQRLLALVSSALDREPTVEDRRRALCRTLVEQGLVDLARLSVEDADGQWEVRAGAGPDPETERLIGRLSGEWTQAREAMDRGEPLLYVIDEAYIAASSSDPGQRRMRRALRMNSAGLVPLSARGRVIGLLAAARRGDSPALDPADLALLAEVGQRAAIALDNASLLAAETDARRTAEELTLVVTALSGATTVTQVTEVIFDYFGQLGAIHTVVALRAGDHLTLADSPRQAGSRGAAPRTETPRWPRLDAPHPLAHAVRTGQPVWSWSPGSVPGADPPGPSEFGPPPDVVIPLRQAQETIGAIALRFPGGAADLSEPQRATVLTVAGQCAQALDRARLHQVEHEVADVLQRSLLPATLPGLARLDIAARYLPGTAHTQAGGDWYDLIPLDDGRLALAVGDVVGHGPPAAAIMGQLRSALAAYLLDGHSPAAALERLDRFAGRVPSAMGSTCACAILDRTNGELTWARAGHPPILLVDRDGGARALDAGGGTVLAVPGRPPYREARAAVRSGDSLLLFTDGLVERRGEVIDDGLDRLAVAADALRGRPADQLAEAVVARMVEDAAPDDDVALVVVRLLSSALLVKLPATPASTREARRAATAWAATEGLSEELTMDLRLAMDEATANAVEHAYPPGAPGEFEVELTRTSLGAVTVRVRDWGRWQTPAADPGFRGRGLGVIHTLSEVVSLDRDGEGTEVSFTLSPEAAGAAPPAPSGPRERDRPASRGEPDSDGRRTVTVSGDLDFTSAHTVRPALFDALLRSGEVVLDLRGLRYLSSAGVGLIVEAAAAGRAASLSILTVADSAVARILSLTGLDGNGGVTVTSTAPHPEGAGHSPG
jgi:anti-anti-sigma factor